MRFTLLILLNLFSLFSFAQKATDLQTVSIQIDSLYYRLFYDQQNQDTVAVHQSLDEISRIIIGIEKDYPLLTGITRLHQFYYATHSSARIAYRTKAMQDLQGSGEKMAEDFSAQMHWLIEGFHLDNRMEEWMSVDSLFRNELYTGNTAGAEKYIVTEFANKKLGEKKYKLANDLAKYDEIYFKQLNSTAPYDRISLLFAQWIQLKQNLDQWLETSYDKRSNLNFNFNSGQIIPDFLSEESETGAKKVDFKLEFEKLFEDMQKLQGEMVKQNKRLSKNYNEGYRSSYYFLYNLFIQNFYTWAINDHKIPEAILPVKKFLIEDVMAEELTDAKGAGQKPVISVNDLKTLVKNLSSLYYEIGNAVQSADILYRGQKVIEQYPAIHQDEYMLALVEMTPYSIRAARLEGDFNRANRMTKTLKNITSKPDSLTQSKLSALEWYGGARVEEIFSLMAQKRQSEAIDSLVKLIDVVAGLPTDNEELIYSTRLWTKLQYLTSVINAGRGKWNDVLIQELIADLLRNDQVTDEIFYPSQLLALKAIWFDKKTIHTGYLQNLLFYTGRQLQNNFILLSAEERMQMYARNMNDYFDVYHELLFSRALDSFPDIKQEVLSQSLYLKNALADGNIIPDEIFIHENSVLTKELLDQIRGLRQDVKRNYLNARLFNLQTTGADMNDKVQSMWLNYLNRSDKELLLTMQDWKQISKKVKPGQIYLETVRYNRWLSDSTVQYGVYLIDADNRIHYMNLCSEKELVNILNQPGSSPQTTSLTGTAKRGNELLGKSNKNPKTFQPGDIDLLGALLLKPIAGFLSGKKEMLMVHDGLLNRISYAALQMDKQYLISHLQLRQMSSSNEMGADQNLPKSGSHALLAGGLDYGVAQSNHPNRLFVPEINWSYLPGTKKETEMLTPVFQKQGYTTSILSGNNFSDSFGIKLQAYQFIHLATHGFYYDSITANQVFDNQFSRDAMQQEPLFRSGLAISGANNPTSTKTTGVPGYLMGYELANIDLRNCYLISLSACETGLGDLRNNLGVDGLSRALKIAGAKNLLISLWKVPDEPTAVFMHYFYTALFSGKSPAAALQTTQLTMSKTYPASAWAAFILVE